MFSVWGKGAMKVDTVRDMLLDELQTRSNLAPTGSRLSSFLAFDAASTSRNPNVSPRPACLCNLPSTSAFIAAFDCRLDRASEFKQVAKQTVNSPCVMHLSYKLRHVLVVQFRH